MKTIVTITGPTCSGKDHLLKYFQSLGHAKLVSTTTRPKRPGEVDGEGYYFITEQEFEALNSAGLFSQTVQFSNYNYGVTYAEIHKRFETQDVVFVIVEPSGVPQYERVARELECNIFKMFVQTSDETINERVTERTIESLLVCNLDREKVAGILRRHTSVITGEERSWHKVHEWNVVVAGTESPEVNYLQFLTALNARDTNV